MCRALAGTGFVHYQLRRRASRPQLKRGSLGSAAHSYSMYEASRQAVPALFLACAILTACAARALWRLTPSPIISPGSSLPAVHVPDTMNVGVPDTVTVWTSGGGCTRFVAPHITSDDLQVTIRLLDSVSVWAPDDTVAVCPAVRLDHRNKVVISFARPGTALVRVIGSDTSLHSVVVR